MSENRILGAMAAESGARWSWLASAIRGLVFAAIALVPTIAHAEIVILTPGQRSAGASVSVAGSDGIHGVYSQADSASSDVGEFDAAPVAPRSPGPSSSDASAKITSFVSATRSSAVVSLAGDCSNVPYPVGAAAQGSGLVFRLTTPATVHLLASFQLATSQIANWDSATISLYSGTYDPNLGFRATGTLASRYWVPGSANNTWSPGDTLDQTLTLAPGDYQYGWGVSFGQGGSNTQLGYTGSGSMLFSQSLTLSSAAVASAGCVAITSNLASQIPLGSVVQIDGSCCEGPSVPALGRGLWGVAALAVLLLACFAIMRGRRRTATALIVAISLGVPRGELHAQSCGLTWEARSATEVFTGAGAHFAFTPTRPGTFLVTLTGNGGATATRAFTVTECANDAQCNDGNACTADTCSSFGLCAHAASSGSCDDGQACTSGDFCSGTQCISGSQVADGTTCGTDKFCRSGLCGNYELTGRCCGSGIATLAEAGIQPLLTGQSDLGGCAARAAGLPDCLASFQRDPPPPACSDQGASVCSALPASMWTTANGCMIGSRAADVISGLSSADRISGGPGNDDLNGLMGDDIVNGDSGDDTVHGGRGSDCLNGGKGIDHVYGDLDDDRLSGDRGDDDLHGGDGDDIYTYNLQNIGVLECTSAGTLNCQPSPVSDGFDQILDETGGTDTLSFVNANHTDLCVYLPSGSSELAIRYCQGQVTAGAVTVPAYKTNTINRIAISGN